MSTDLENLCSAFSAGMRSVRTDYHLTLGELIDALQKMDQNKVVIFDDTGDSPGVLGSYHRYYADLAFDYARGIRHVSEVLLVARAALGTTFHGYKGGEFVMERDTPLWWAAWGHSMGRAIVGIRECPELVVSLQTKEVLE